MEFVMLLHILFFLRNLSGRVYRREVGHRGALPRSCRSFRAILPVSGKIVLKTLSLAPLKDALVMRK